MSSRKRSFIWTSFSEVAGPKEAKRNFCYCIVKFNEGSTSNLHKHMLETKEPLISTLALANPNLESLSENEWDIISKACEVLKLFEEITPEMCSQKKVRFLKLSF